MSILPSPRLLSNCPTVIFLLSLSLAVISAAAEDGKVGSLPEGVEIWLDASSLQPAGLIPKTGVPISQWSDLSKKNHHARQADVSKQPRLMAIDNGYVVRFDGDDDHLRAQGVNKKLTEFTLFMVAAPHSNQGLFRGLFAFNQFDTRDYETGFTLDMNGAFSARLDNVNLEGRGFGGARNLLKTPSPFGTLHVFECTADPRTKLVRLVMDGQPQLDRPFAPTDLIMDDVTIGARFYTNEPNQPHQVRGSFQGDIAELLLFNRVLSEAESAKVRAYLDQKYSSLRDALPRELKMASRSDAETLVTVTDPPPIQMLVPGFSVTELPVDLTNVNNVRYAPDGRMYALGYNGDVWLLSDSNKDGLEETAKRFFDSKGRLRGPIGMAVIPQGHALLKSKEAKGVVVPSKGKVSAILDNDGDDIADEERVIASGWQEIVQNVDAIGIDFDRQGAIYFGLGTTDYSNAYLVDKQGKGNYDLAGEHGTIQRIEPDLSKRTTVCTGVRFTIGMGFNEKNDLFVTDQEGATWLPNGNPYDELLHIEQGKHYGFPPRHPKHLPGIIDQPSVYDYEPQHQSTCGMAFNVPVRRATASQAASPTFGPHDWRGDVFVCGESRGKLYRTELTAVAGGQYVARNHLIGCLSMLTVDCCVSPLGDLIVACHSGGPDWGSGPSGKGKLFRIRYVEPEAPQPVIAWSAGTQEVRIAFDRPLNPSDLKEVASQTRITYGQYVAAGDRFETIWPGYAVVQMQKMAPRFKLPVYGASVSPDRKTLILSTALQQAAVNYAITLPRPGRERGAQGELPQHPQIDIAYSLTGVAATWESQDKSDAGWSGWLPHLDPDVMNAFRGSEEDPQRPATMFRMPGTLRLETQLQLKDLAHPAVQPGSKLDYNYPPQAITIRMKCRPSDVPSMQVYVDDVKLNSIDSGLYTWNVKPDSVPRLKIIAATKDGYPIETITWSSSDLKSRSIPLSRFLLPWASPSAISAPTEAVLNRDIAELKGGSWGRGRRVFFSDDAGCAKCHVAHEKYGRIGPDLSNLIHRDYASVLRDVTLPSFALNPDYLSSIVSLKDGRVITGAVRSEGAKLLVCDKDGKVHVVSRDDVDEMQHSTISIMPEGIPKKLGPDRMKDLLTYLLTPLPNMPLESPLPPPAPRTREDVAKILAGSQAFAGPSFRKLNLLLVGGAKDHGPGEHDYPAWLRIWSELLRGADNVSVETAMEWPSADQISQADTIVFFQKGSWNAQRATAMDAHLARGKGLVYIHWAVEAGPEAPAFAQRIGLASDASKLKFRHGPLDLGFETGKDHPIGRNFDKVHFHDESYWQMQGDPSQIRVLATGVEDGRDQPLFWTMEPGKGKVFVSIPGHYSWTFDDPLFRVLLLRGIAWTASESVDRFNELTTVGVKFAN